MINGANRVLYIKWVDEFLPIGCLTSDSFNESVEMLDTTTRDNEGWKTSTPTNQSYNIDFDGIVINTRFNGGDFSKISLDRLKKLKRDRTLIEWKSQDTDLTFIESGFGYITSLSDNASIDEFITFNASLEGYGSPTITTGISFELQDGNSNILQDGNNNNIITG
jgi:predicted secreted protein